MSQDAIVCPACLDTVPEESFMKHVNSHSVNEMPPQADVSALISSTHSEGK